MWEIPKIFYKKMNKNSLLFLVSVRMHENPKNDPLLEENSKIIPYVQFKYAAIWKIGSAELALESKMQSNTFWKMSNFPGLHISVVPNINFNKKGGFKDIKICRKCKSWDVWIDLKSKLCFLRQSSIKYLWLANETE